jgi:hypothetical protein
VGRSRCLEHRALVFLLSVVVVLLVLPAVAGATTSFTWSGEGAPGSDWSNSANWGSSAPSGKTGTLTFPVLTSAGCTAEPRTDTCYDSNNDIPGLEVNELAIDDGAEYFLNGDAITLGAGGIDAFTSHQDNGLASATIANIPISLGASQTWSVTGSSGFQSLDLDHVSTTGNSSDKLTINFVEFGFLSVNGDSSIEAGELTLQGAGQMYLNGGEHFGTPAANTSSGNAVNIDSGTLLTAADATAGPLNVSGGTLEVGQPGNPGSLAVTGNVVFDSAATYRSDLNKAGTTAGTDFSQLTSTGNVSLSGAALSLEDGFTNEGEGCHELTPGDVDTLISTTGSISGTFNGVPNEATISLTCGAVGVAPTARIHYAAHEVTATVETSGSSKAVSKEQEEAAAKKKAKEEAAAKKKGEEEAAAKKKAEEEATAKKKAEEEASASVKIEKFKVTTSSLVVTIKTSQAGTVTITGRGLKKTTRTVAAGTHKMTVALTKAGKAERKGHKKIKLSVSLKMSIKTVSRSVEVKL